MKLFYKVKQGCSCYFVYLVQTLVGTSNYWSSFTDTSDRLSESSIRTQHGALLCMRGACPKGTYRTMQTVEPHSRFAPFVEDGVYAVPVCSTCHILCRTCTGYSVLRATNTTPGCVECHGFWFKDTCIKECPEGNKLSPTVVAVSSVSNKKSPPFE